MEETKNAILFGIFCIAGFTLLCLTLASTFYNVEVIMMMLGIDTVVMAPLTYLCSKNEVF